MSKPAKVAIVGYGPIAAYVTKHIGADASLGLVGVVCREGREATASRAMGEIPAATRLETLPAKPDLVADCGGHAALRQHGPEILRAGIDLVTVSIGALADDGLAEELDNAARTGNSKLLLASGSIGALDVVGAASIEGLQSLTYRGRKPPDGWKGSPAEDKLDLDGLTEAATHFEGTAREAAIRYPKNANVAAAVGLAGPGLNATRVELIADPSVTQNIHEIEAHGSFGELNFQVRANPFPDNPKSSMLAAMSTVSTIRRYFSTISN